jgi:hypothetical protein
MTLNHLPFNFREAVHRLPGADSRPHTPSSTDIHVQLIDMARRLFRLQFYSEILQVGDRTQRVSRGD